jgi:hypothetical protein
MPKQAPNARSITWETPTRHYTTTMRIERLRPALATTTPRYPNNQKIAITSYPRKFPDVTHTQNRQASEEGGLHKIPQTILPLLHHAAAIQTRCTNMHRVVNQGSTATTRSNRNNHTKQASAKIVRKRRSKETRKQTARWANQVH